jgi:hypothetical protein
MWQFVNKKQVAVEIMIAGYQILERPRHIEKLI